MPSTTTGDPATSQRAEISVIVCTRNRARSLDRTLSALVDQVLTPGLAWEVVVVDNGSSDATASVIASWAGRIQNLIRGVVEPTPGLARARNRGIATARGEILAFTDDDVLPSPDWITSIRQAFARDGADIVGGRILPRWGAPPPPWLLANRFLLQQLSLIDQETRGLVDYATSLRVWGSNISVRRSVFEDIGTFDPSLGRVDASLYNGEDTDLVKRACAAGKLVIYDPQLVVYHCIDEDRMTRHYFRKRAFDHGQHVATKRNRAERTIFGIPTVVYRYSLVSLSRVLLATFDSVRRFKHELGFIYNLGVAVGCLTTHDR